MTEYRLRNKYHELVNKTEHIKHLLAESNDCMIDQKISKPYYKLNEILEDLNALWNAEDKLIIQRENELLKLKVQVESHQPITLKNANFQHCVSCGLKIPLQSNFCEHCGAKI